jgi:serine/threonine protein phosphatase PrpC
MPQLTACPSCADHLEPEDRFCGNCGAAVSATPAEPAASAAPTVPAPAQAPAPAPPAPAAPAAPSSVPASAPRSDASAVDDPRRRMMSGGPGEPQAGQGWSGPPGTGGPGEPGTSGEAGRPGEPGSTADVPGGLDVVFDQPAGDGGSAAAESVAAAGSVSAAESVTAAGSVSEAGDVDEDTAEMAVTPCAACEDGTVDADGYCGLCGHAQPRERDHVERESARHAGVSDRGLRHHRNEDDFALGETTLPDGTPTLIGVVCDGVSSASRPDEASAAAARAAREKLVAELSGGTDPREAMRLALLAADAAVCALDAPGAADDPHANSPACTGVFACLSGDLLTVGWVGDSRAYWIPDDRSGGGAARLTEDDSWAARMVEAGLLSEAEAYADPRAHAITGWLGPDPEAEELEPHVASYQLDRPGVVVVCTDGLWNYVESAPQMAAVVPADARTAPLASARKLVDVAIGHGGHDNITVALLPYPVPDAR